MEFFALGVVCAHTDFASCLIERVKSGHKVPVSLTSLCLPVLCVIVWLNLVSGSVRHNGLYWGLDII